MFSHESFRKIGLSILGKSRADTIARMLFSYEGKATVLAYHSVSDVPDYAAPSIQVGCKDFERQIIHLKEHYNVVPLATIAKAMETDWDLPDRTVAITFDDGYANNIENALPILKKHGVPASLYVTVSPVLEGAPFWVGRLERATRRTTTYKNLAETLNARRSLKNQSDAFGKAAAFINKRSGQERRSAIEQIEHALIEDGAQLDPSPDNFMATREQLQAWVEAGMEIGAHSLTHPILTSLDDEEARCELESSKNLLEQALGVEISSLAYPNGPGMVSNVDERIVNLAKNIGYKYAVTSKRGAVNTRSSVLAIPRIAVNERLRGDAFRWKLERGFTQKAPKLPTRVTPSL